MKLAGSFYVPLEPEKTVGYMTNIESIIDCIPNVSRYEVLSTDEFKITFKVDLAKIMNKIPIDYLSRLSVKMNFKFERGSDNQIYLYGNGRGAGVKIKIEIMFMVTSFNNQSKLNYEADVEMGILAKIFGEDTLKTIAEDMANKLIKCLQNKLSSLK